MRLAGLTHVASARLRAQALSWVVLAAAGALGPGLEAFASLGPLSDQTDQALAGSWLNLFGLVAASGGVWALGHLEQPRRPTPIAARALEDAIVVGLAVAALLLVCTLSLALAGIPWSMLPFVATAPKLGALGAVGLAIAPRRPHLALGWLWLAAWVLPQAFGPAAQVATGLPESAHLASQWLAAAGLLLLATSLRTTRWKLPLRNRTKT